MPSLLPNCWRFAAQKFRCSIVLGAVLVIPTNASTQTFEVLGSRALGMAGAFVAVADDATATYWNPAGLASGPVLDLVLERQQGDALMDGRNRPLDTGTRGMRGSSLAFALGTPPLGLSYYRIRTTSLPWPVAGASADRQNVRSREAGVRTLLTQHFGATLVQSLTPRVTLGTTLKIVRGTAAEGSVTAATAEGALTAGTDLDGISRTTFDLDAGLLATYGPWRAGIVGRNLKQPKFAVSAAGPVAQVKLARQLRAGFAFAPRSRPTGVNGPLTLAADVDLGRVETVLGRRRELAIGGERWWAGGRIGGRAGVRLNTLTRDDQHHDPVIAVGFSVSPRSGSLIEGQVTRGQNSLEQGWGITARVTF